MLRHVKLAEAIKKEVSIIVHDELNDPRLGFVTITHVELTDNYRYAKIFFSVLGQEEEHKKTKAALDSALGFIRMLIAKRIRLRFAPELAFKEDSSGEYGMKIERILEEINELSPPPIPLKRKSKEKMEPARTKVRGSQGPQKPDTKAAFIPTLKGGVCKRRSIKKGKIR